MAKYFDNGGLHEKRDIAMREEATTYFLMRHGASESNLQGKVQGVLDVPLAELGRAQAKEAAQVLDDMGITQIYSSPLLRAYNTAQIVGEHLGLSVERCEGLRARDLGEWVGKSRREIKEMWVDLTHPFRNDPDFAPPGGESLREADARVFAAIDQVLGTAGDECPLFVMHLVGIGACVGRVTGGERPAFGNAEVWRVEASAASATVVVKPTETFLLGVE